MIYDGPCVLSNKDFRLDHRRDSKRLRVEEGDAHDN